MLAYACHSDYSMAIIPARATAALNALSVEFDEDLFYQKRIPVPSTILDYPRLSTTTHNLHGHCMESIRPPKR
jgi:hypothetical protein